MILLFCIQLGLMPYNDFQMWTYSRIPGYEKTMEQFIAVNFELRPIEFIFIGGKIETVFFPRTWKNYVPTKMQYIFKAGVRLSGWEIGFEHLCQHPITPNSDRYNPGIIRFEGGYEKIYVQYEGKLEI